MKITLLLCSILIASAISVSAQDGDQQKAIALFTDGKWQEAEAALKSALAKGPDGQLTLLLGVSQANQKKYKEAIETLSPMYQMDIRSDKLNETRFQLAKCYAFSGNSNKAIAYLNEAAKHGARYAFRLNDSAFVNIKSLPEFQSAKKALEGNSSLCNTDKNYTKMDFFVGNWEVYLKDNNGEYNQKVALDSNYKVTGGCAILENFKWTGGGNFTGKSFCFFDAASQQFVMNWSGSSADIRIFKEIASGPNWMDLLAVTVSPNIRYLVHRRMKMKYDPEKETLHQLIENSYDLGKSWEVEWDAVFKKVK